MWPFKKPERKAIAVEAIVAPPGSTVVLRLTEPITKQQREIIRAALLARHECNPSVRYALFECQYEIAVIGAAQ